MCDLDALLAAIIATPDDDAARLVCADKFEERDRPGDAERANLIRVGGDYTFTVTDNGLLFSEGEPIDAPMLSAWYGVFDQLGSDSWPANVSVSVSRGFIAEVRGPEAALVGGETTRSVYERGEYGPNRYQETIRTPGVLPAIAQAHPLEWVEVVDCEPLRRSNNSVWFSKRLIRTAYDQNTLPNDVFDLMTGQEIIQDNGRVAESDDEICRFYTEHDALAALSRALIAWARKEQP